MKSRSFNNSDKLSLYSPKDVGESIFGRFEKFMSTNNGTGMILKCGNTKLFVPLWSVLKDLEDEIKGEKKRGNFDVFVFICLVGSGESDKGKYNIFSSHLLIPSNESEISECEIISEESDFKEGKKGVSSTCKVDNGCFGQAVNYLGYESGKELLES